MLQINDGNSYKSKFEDDTYKSRRPELIFALSAHITDEDRAFGIEAGFDDFSKEIYYNVV